MSNKLQRKDFMTDEDKKAMGNLPRTHQNCFKMTKKSRPGKTKCEKARKGH